MAVRKQPDQWVEFVLEPYPTAAATTYRWATRPYAGTFFVEGRLPVDGWESIERRASSASGEYHIDSASVLIQDNDGLVRSLLADPTTMWFKNREGAFKLLSEAAFTAGLTPRLLFGGRCYDVQVLDRRHARLEFEDVLAPYLDRTYPQYTLGDAYPYRFTEGEFTEDAEPGTNIPMALRDQVMPIYYGPFIDTAVDPLTGEIRRKGLCPTFFMGYTALSAGVGDVAPPSSDLAPHLPQYNPGTPAFAHITFPSDNSDLYLETRELGASIDGIYSITIVNPGTPNQTLRVEEGGNVVTDGGIRVGTPFGQFTVYLATDGSGNVTTTANHLRAHPAFTPPLANPVYTITNENGSNGTGLLSALSQTFLTGATDAEGLDVVSGWGELFVMLGETDVPNVYGSDLAAEPKRVLLSDDRYEGEVLAPGHPGWPHGTDYVMRNGYRCTIIYARGALLWHHLTGVVNITVDVCGWKNASGVAIDQAGFVYQDFPTQHVLANNGEGYTSGPNAGLPTFADGRAMFWTSKVQDWQSMTADRLGTAKGYLCSMALTSPMTLREWLQTWHLTFDAYSAKNAAGQLYPFSIDDLASPTSGVPVRERIELENLPAPRIAWEEIENEIHYQLGFDPEQNTARTSVLKLKDQPSIDALKEDKKKPPPSVRWLKFTADDATAADAMGRRLMRLKRPPRYQALPVRTDGVDREISEQVLTSHRDGIGPMGVGYLETPMVIVGHVQKGHGITLEAFDVSAILESVAVLGADSLTTWDAASAGDREAYLFAANDDGLVPSGMVAAKEIR